MPPVSSGKSPLVQPDISQPLVDGPFAAPREDHPSLPIAVGEALSTSASSPRLAGVAGLPDPNTVKSRVVRQRVEPEFSAGLQSKAHAPKAAEWAARYLLARFGPFNASNTPENREAIVQHLLWLGSSSSGIAYKHERVAPETAETGTYSPNRTVSDMSGVCRDTHVALGAIMGSLMNATADGASGKWRLGSPARAGDVFISAYFQPDEAHAFMLYRDPATGKWNGIEYGAHYAMQAPTGPDAHNAIVGDAAGYYRYVINGWDESPTISEHAPNQSSKVRDFFLRSPGRGAAGEVSMSGGTATIDGLVRVTEGVAVTGRVNPTALSEGRLEGGVMAHYTSLDKDDPAAWSGSYHVAGGVHHERLSTTPGPGRRALAHRADYDQVAVGARFDGRTQSPVYPLGFARLRLGADVDALLLVPYTAPKNDKSSYHPSRILHYSHLKGGADATLSGDGAAGAVTADWALWARMRLDGMLLANDLSSSVSNTFSLSNSLLREPWVVGGRVGAAHRDLGPWQARVELGGELRLVPGLDEEVTARSTHYMGVRLLDAERNAELNVMVLGEWVDGEFRPARHVAAGLEVKPHESVTFHGGGAVDVKTGQVQATIGARVDF